MRTGILLSSVLLCWLPVPLAYGGVADVVVRGEIVDADTGRLLPARIYIRSAEGDWYFPVSSSPEGTAVEYRKQRFETSVEMHTTLSAHPFYVELPPGRYTVTAERGKEYLPAQQTFDVKGEPVELRLELRRWIDMAAAGWYSGDTHVHRQINELPNLTLAEDLNVALPLSYWVTRAGTPPSAGNRNSGADLSPEPVHVDATHVIYPVNTEYELFSVVGGKRHTLGAVFVLGHQRALELGAPPVRPIAEESRRQGALLDLDKHSWPWSLMLVPVMNVDLFELANNHMWRTEFGFRNWTEDAIAEYMHLERDERGLTEWGWIDFGFQSYYALLNCGFRMRPTAGTASGVHPVPLGFGRVYVHLPNGFDYRRWIRGLAAGRSFVTTGPMLRVETDGQPPGATISLAEAGPRTLTIRGTAQSSRPLRTIEVIKNGQVARRIEPENRSTTRGGYESPFTADVAVDGSCWVAVRVFENRPRGRLRFAHSSPVHVEMAGRPLRPRKEEVAYFIRRMQEELSRNEGVLDDDALAEYRQALSIYEAIAKTAR